MKGYPTITEEERRQFKNYRDAHPEMNYNQQRYQFFKQIGRLDKIGIIAKDSRKKTFTPDDFPNTELKPDPEAKYGWSVFDNGKYKVIHTPPECTSKKQHLYVYVTIKGGGASSRIMSLAALIWLVYLKREIPAGYVVDHIDEDPLNNRESAVYYNRG